MDLFDDLIKNYAEALARFRALNWLPDEDLVFVASRETNEVSGWFIPVSYWFVDPPLV